MDRWMVGCVDGWRDGYMYGWMYGLMDGWIDGWMHCAREVEEELELYSWKNDARPNG